jgi:PAS domain S-box-containing protein
MFKIQRSSNGKSVVFSLSGRIQAAALTDLQKLLKDEAGDHNVALDLKDVKLVNRDMVLFLASCSSMRSKRISSTRHLEPKDMQRRALKASEVGVAVEGKNMSEREILQSKSDIPFEDSIPEAGASLESILCTEELQRRPSRPPDYERENCALVALVSALADSPSTVLQALAETILDITQCDSAGLSLLTRDGKRPDAYGMRFYWPAIAGMWNPHVGGGTPRNFGPCGDVLDQNRTLLFRHFERRYTYFLPVTPLIEECLLVPFYVRGKAVGTIWAIMHSDRRKFDAEDDRVMGSLGKFASSAYQALVHIDDLKFQVAEREKAEAEVRELASGLEAKVRRLVDANIIGIVIGHLEGRIIDANEAFLRMVGYDREDLLSGRVSWREVTLDKWRSADEQAVAELAATGVCTPFEKEYFRKDGSRVPVLVGAALLEGSRDEGVAFALDLSELKRAEDEIRVLHAELAHINRVTAMGQLAASITHELNQPLTAMITNADVGLRWLDRQPPDVEEARQTLDCIIKDGKRGRDVIGQIRALIKKEPLRKDDVEINEAILEVIALTHGEAVKHGVSVQTQLAEGLPLIRGDRVQLQQVILNLILNAVQAMSGVTERTRELLIGTGQEASGAVLVTVQDSGPGFTPESFDRLFDSFYTTKAEGMGMGLSICRSIVDAHGGRIWASLPAGLGAAVQFCL